VDYSREALSVLIASFVFGLCLSGCMHLNASVGGKHPFLQKRQRKRGTHF
jgi:hypothetical protein